MYKYTNVDCFEYIPTIEAESIHAIVTDPPYGVREYTHEELTKKKNGKGGIWRLPQSFDGHTRQPVPRFSVINEDENERNALYSFFFNFASIVHSKLAPGAHAFIASTPLLCDIVSIAFRDAGYERRGEIIRTVCTLRGGDRPKGAEQEFLDVCVMPRGLWEPWLLFRKPISESTIAANLRKWKTGALRRVSEDSPFVDYIESGKTPQIERTISHHPSLKPQLFLRKIVYASLPLGEGLILDPFAGSGSTLAAAEYLGIDSIGFERNIDFFNEGRQSIPKLSQLYPDQMTLFNNAIQSKKENMPAQVKRR